MDQEVLEKLQERIGYRFAAPALLRQALCHSSYVNEHRRLGLKDNERLEFLGDAVLELCSSEFIYHAYPEMPEGKMSRLRASLVCEPTLAQCARQIDLPGAIALGRGEEHTGGRERDSIVSDAMEALIGALFLDGGLTAAKEFVRKYILTDLEHKKLFYDSKTILQEVAQGEYRGMPLHYELTGEEGPPHAKTFRVSACLGERVIGTGTGPTKKAAEQEAAYRALLMLRSASGEDGE